MTFTRTPSSLLGLNPLLRVAGAVLGLALIVAVMLFALVVGICVLLWAKLRGRSTPGIRFVWQNLRHQRGAHQAQASRPHQATGGMGQIVDIEAREIKS